MRKQVCIAAVCIASTTAAPLALASRFDHLQKNAEGLMNSGTSTTQSTGSSSALLSRFGTGSMSLASMPNAAGVLGYCLKHSYGQSATQRVKDRLIDKLGGPAKATTNDDYKTGQNGILNTDSGQRFSLTSLKKKATQRACKIVTDKAQSAFLGG